MKKLLTLLLTLLLLASCTSVKEDAVTSGDLKTLGTSYFEELKSFEPKDIREDNLIDNQEFNDYLNDVFIYFVNTNYLSIHTNLKDYKAYGIEKPEVNLGEIKFEPDEKKIYEEINYLNRLLEFDYDTLSANQQLTYQTLLYSFYEDLSGIGYTKYSKLFDYNAGLISDLVGCLNEFVFFEEDDVKDYLTLVLDVPRYLNEAIDYSDKQYESGIYYSDYSINNTIDYLNSVISKQEDNALIISFDDRINDLDFLSEKDKQDFKAKNKELVLDSLIPSFKKLADKLLDYKGKITSRDNTLVNISKEYSELSFMIKFSDNRDLDIVFEELIDSYNSMIETILSHNDEEFLKIIDEVYNKELFSKEHRDIIDYLIESLPNDDLIKNNLIYKVNDIDKSIDDGNTLAYYVIPQVDSKDNNVVKVSSMTTNDLSLYLTLAHEAVPGHMYQHNYFETIKHPEIREILSFIGESEGWAMYSEFVALNYLNLDEEVIDFIYAYETHSYLLNCILDLAINYYGYNDGQIKDLIGLDKETIDFYYDFLTDMPCLYGPYGVGGMNIYNLYLETKDELNDDFNLKVLKNGIVPFPILRSLILE